MARLWLLEWRLGPQDTHPLIEAENDFNHWVIRLITEQAKTMTRKDNVISVRAQVKSLGVSNIGVSISQ